MGNSDKVTPEERLEDAYKLGKKTKANIIVDELYWEVLGKYAKDQSSKKSIIVGGLIECLFGILTMDAQGKKEFEGANFQHVINTIIHRTTGSEMMTYVPDNIKESE